MALIAFKTFKKVIAFRNSYSTAGFFLLLVLIYNLIVFYYINLVLSQTGGIYVYPLDDSYIHMELAVKFSGTGTWGIENGIFSSASSSPLFLLVNALLIKVFGNLETLPLIAGILVSNLVLYFIYRFSRLSEINPVWMMIFMISPVLLHVQAISGMEHSWHILLVFVSLVIFNRIIHEQAAKSEIYGFILLLLLLCMVRYESMFVVVAFAFGFFVYGKFRWSAATLFLGFLPIVLAGVFFMINGGHFFPNTLLIKGNLGIQYDLWSKLQDYASRIFSLFYQPNFALPVVICLGSLIFSFYEGFYIHKIPFIRIIRSKILIIVVISILLMHTMFASFGWLFRYEAYLFVILYFVTCLEVKYLSKQFLRHKEKVFYSLMLLLVVFSYPRLSYSNEVMKYASKNIHDQPYQMSRFFKNYYNNSYVMINDIGTTAYYTDAHIIDVVGLASNEILESVLMGRDLNDERFIKLFNSLWVDKCKVAFFSDINHSSKVLRMGWVKVGELIIKNNVICVSDRIHIYAADDLEAIDLKTKLEDFSKSLPDDVIIRFE